MRRAGLRAVPALAYNDRAIITNGAPAGHVLPREALIERVWGPGSDIESNTLDAFVRLLRGKIEAAGEAKLIHTFWGVGYSLRQET